MFYTYLLLAFWGITFLMRKLAPQIYDVVIIHMTKVWYKVVLEKVPSGSNILDIGTEHIDCLILVKILIVAGYRYWDGHCFD